MSRKYSSWASNQPLINPDLSMMRLTTIMGNEQDQLKNLERVEAIPHMYINVDAPPQPTTRMDARAMQPAMISRQNSSYFAAPMVVSPPANVQTKIWPMEKPSKNSSSFESASSTSKRHHKHKHHHHHHHHSDKHHHHNRRHRATSAESIRNRQHQAMLSPSKVVIANPQYIEQDQQQQQQQQQQPMVVYREVSNGEGYTVDQNGLATVPYGMDNETGIVDDQQAPYIVYRDANFPQQQQHQQQIMSDGMSQQVFFNQDQEAFIQQNDPFGYFPQQQQQSSQIVYSTDPNNQDYLCTSNNNNNIIQQSISPQQQFVCVDNTPTIQPTFINQIPVFNSLSANTTSPSVMNVPQTSLQRATSFIIQQPQSQPQQLQILQQQQQQQPLQILQQQQQPLQILQQQQQPLQILQQQQPLQVLQQQQPLQVLQQQQPLQILQQQQQPLQVFQQPQQLQIMQNPQAQQGQFLQLGSAAPQMIQTIQPQVIQAQPVVQTMQMPAQNIAANPQILYQRPYDPVVMPMQNQQMGVVNSPLVALSQPSYAPSRIMPATSGIQSQGPNMFRHALLRSVADRSGVPIPTASTGAGAVQLMQPTAGAHLASNPNLLLAGRVQRSASLPIVPLTPGGLLIPFRPAQTPGLRPGPLPRAGGYPSNLQNFTDIRQQLQQQRAQLLQSLQQPNYSRIPSPPVLSAAPINPTTPYSSRNIFASGARSSGSSVAPLTSPSYAQLPSPRLPYTQPSYAGSSGGSITSTPSGPYQPLRI